MKILTLFLLLGFAMEVGAQTDSLGLAESYQMAYKNYPTAKNIELQKKITDLKVQVAHNGYYPDVEVGGKSSYQSEVTDFPIPGGAGPPAVSKDQYEASLNVTQNIYIGGAVGIRKDLERARGEQQIHSTEIELHQIRSQVDQVYFGILLSQQQQRVNKLLLNDLQQRLEAVSSQVKNGVLLTSQQHILKAELIKAQQDSVSIASNIKAGYQVLGELTGSELDAKPDLSLPKVPADYRSMQPRRPEYEMFKSREQTLQEQMRLVETQKKPRVSAFGTAAYGRPGLNFLDDDFHDYYIVGLRLRWNIQDFFTADLEKQALQIEQQKVTQNQQAFTRQLLASLYRLREQISSIRENIKRDKQIIELRNKIVKESASQLDNGVITATEYVTELIRANRARLALVMNRVQLAKVQIAYATALGIPIQ